jgi:hypothetical protein
LERQQELADLALELDAVQEPQGAVREQRPLEPMDEAIVQAHLWSFDSRRRRLEDYSVCHDVMILPIPHNFAVCSKLQPALE